MSSSSSMLSTATSASSSGLIDVASIVSQLMTVEQQPLTLLQTNEASYQAKLSAYGTIQSALSTFQGAVSQLDSASAFQALNVGSSNSSVATATAKSTAVPGNYTLAVTNLAQAQQLVASGQTSDTAAIGSGASTTLTFNFGTVSGGTSANGKYTGATFTPGGSATKTVTIDSSNNSLQGIAAAINGANIGVTASIVNDGSSTPYRLSLSSNASGAANSMQISVAGDAALSSLLSQDPSNNSGQNFTETAAAQNANFTLNGISISKPTNTVTDAINGLTLNLTGTSTSPISLSVAQNTTAMTTAVNSFVSAYNALDSTLLSSSAYNAATGTGAILQGDPTVMMLQSQLRGALNVPINSAGSALSSLPDIGVTFQQNGTLTVDSAQLNTAITSNYGNIAALFASVGQASDPLVSYSSVSSNTQPGNYAVTVSALATQGSTIGNVNLNSAPTTIAANTSVNVTLDGTTASVALTAGSYTATQLAAMIQSAINSSSTFSALSSSVTASIDSNGFLNVLSSRYSSASNIGFTNGAGTSIATFLGTPTTSSGTDVAGTIDGAAASGSGQKLTSASGNSNGLVIQISGGATGARGTVSYSQGYAYTLNQLATNFLAPGSIMASATSGINSIIAGINNQMTALNTRLASLQQSYTKEFTALDSSLSSMQSTSNFLTQQLAALPKA
jgi:flagellar hook-associated protein 2